MSPDMVDNVKASIIIPVFNKASALPNCVNSIVEQIPNQTEFEIILINDGSTDNSEDVCRRIEKQFSAVSVVSKQNGGVSSARNVGINVAKGTYLIFLDADDELGPGSIQALVDAFERYGDEVDLVTYPIIYVNAKTGFERGHKREKWLIENRVYDLNEYPFICQTTMNVCVKREVALRHLFSTSLTMGEDQLFNTEVLAERGAIGYCADASYRYIRDGQSSSAKGNKPVYIFDEIVDLFSSFLRIGKQNPNMQEYCNQMILYNFWWRLASGCLFPEFGDADERKRNRDRLNEIGQSIPFKSYFDSPYMNAVHKPYLLDAFGLLPEGLSVVYEKSKAFVYLDDELVWKTKAPLVRLIRCVNDGRNLHLMGVLESVVSYIDKRSPRLVLHAGNRDVELDLRKSSREYANTRQRITRAWYFEVDLAIPENRETIKFDLSLDGEPVSIAKIVTPLLRSNARRDDETGAFYYCNCSLKINKNKMVLSRSKDIGVVHEFIRDYRVQDREVGALRRKIKRTCKKLQGSTVWMYSDLPTSPIRGNAFYQFLHDSKIDDGVRRFYVTNYVDEVTSDYPELSNHVLAHRSQEHLQYYFASHLILTSYLEASTFLPCDRNELYKLGDLLSAKVMVYLQHGILHAHIPWYFSYDRIMFDYEVISTEFERTNLNANYHFPLGKLIDSGAPRLDALNPKASKTRRILYAPSWRSYLVTGDASNWLAVSDRFLRSEFFAGFTEFVKAVSDSGILERYGYVLELKLHPNLSVYKEYLPLEDPRVVLASDSINEDEYAVMITDYSSYVYDFVYAGSKIIYFLPDRREFEGGANHYSKLDLPIEDGFGPFTSSPEEMVDLLEEVLRDQDDTAGISADKQYEQRRQSFFIHYDGKNAERLYQRLKKL